MPRRGRVYDVDEDETIFLQGSLQSVSLRGAQERQHRVVTVLDSQAKRSIVLGVHVCAGCEQALHHRFVTSTGSTDKRLVVFGVHVCAGCEQDVKKFKRFLALQS